MGTTSIMWKKSYVVAIVSSQHKRNQTRLIPVLFAVKQNFINDSKCVTNFSISEDKQL